ncbi:prephenate dehydratase [Aurantibacter sp.]|uniref:prephenate dehydratase n=1 Tax=Aurantibacter sp. TaxID=2807103 RepID=UPI0035C8188E
MEKSIAIQGVMCSYHHMVSNAYFGKNTKINQCLSFDFLAESLANKESDCAVMAIENSIAGSIIPNYAIIDANAFNIVGEHYLDIQHQFMVLPGQTMEEISEVHSHPMALLQCKTFLRQYPHVKLVEAEDTAVVAERIREKNLKGIAAIAGKLAAETYNLDVLAASIQTIKQNQTRFVILSNNKNKDISKSNKASIKFELDHKRGSLATILNVMSDCKLSLTKIQSLPKIEEPWRYSFFVDVTFSELEDFIKAEKLISLMATHYKVLGIYNKAVL